VFLFGALPLMRKHGCPRLVIGDEYDATDRRTHEGIKHFNGLYDQSRYFDQALTKYFQRKGWGVSQFSILRPISELVVEKILLERYPDVQALQVSCHAAHMDGERVRPCGNCEKCGRVVAMLTALGGDPTRCGYTPPQIERCLANIAKRGAAQEGAAIQQLAYLLKEHGALPGGSIASLEAKRRPEIMQVRFDPQHSQMDDIPTDLRRPLYRLLLEHAAGAVQRVGRAWVAFDPLTSDEIDKPYPFETAGENGKPTRPTAPVKRTHILGELTWPEAKQRFSEVDVALLPVGAVEQHGPHLPLDTDAYDAELLSREVAARCSDPKPLVLPLIPYGVSYHHDDFAGTISVGPETLSRLVYEVGMSVVRHGVTKLVIVNGHGGNAPALQFAAQLINRDGHVFTCVDSGETSDMDVEALAETPSDVHAGEIETSTSLANRPHLVQMDKAEPSVPEFSSHYLDFSSNRGVDWYARTVHISPSGVLGDPTKASREKGEKMWQLMIDHLVTFVEDLKSMSLDEIHQKSQL
jgi:creatinine amidohydrolase/Fe(II)-dependent formamide hydrolase-like protein